MYHVVSLRDDADVGACRVEAKTAQVPLEGTVHVHGLTPHTQRSQALITQDKVERAEK